MLPEEKSLLQRAAIEIRQLRNQNQGMSARLDMFDKVMLLLHTQPNYQGQGMSPDVVFEIEKFIEKDVTPN